MAIDFPGLNLISVKIAWLKSAKHDNKDAMACEFFPFHCNYLLTKIL
jgi:hypothetical protein